MEPATNELIGDGVDSVHIWQANLVCVLSTLSFYSIGEVLTRFGKPTYVATDVEFWKWRNIVISWIHGIVCGLWDFLWFVYICVTKTLYFGLYVLSVCLSTASDCYIIVY